jgi:hypothetical protein
MTKKTVVDIKALKQALNELNALSTEMGHSDSAASKLQDATTISQDLGQLIDGGGPKIAQYVDARTRAITMALQQSSAGLQSAISMLQTTITNYETNEQVHTAAANGTGNGGAGSSSGSSGPGAARGVG